MESHKNKILRIVNTIYDVTPGTVVKVTNSDGDNFIFRCKCYDNNYDLYEMNNKHTSWGLSCDTLDDMRDSLLKDFLEELLFDIKIM